MTKLKLCGMMRTEDIAAVNLARPDYVGFVFAKSRRQITAKQAWILRQQLRSDIPAVGVFVNARTEEIAALLQNETIQIAQLHGQETEADLLQLKEKLPQATIIKAIHVTSSTDILPWQSSIADYLLFDHGAGGTGETFDWDQIPASGKPFFLAGGLNSENILEAIQKVQPYGVDLSSGIETNGQKDPKKIQEIVRIITNGNR